MSEAYWISAQHYLFNRLRSEHGLGGVTLQNVSNMALVNVGNGATTLNYSPLWWARHYHLPPAGHVWWYNQLDPTHQSVMSDEIGIFWIAHPEGGQFTVSVSTNGGPWGPLLTLDGFASASRGSIIRAWYRHLPRDGAVLVEPVRPDVRR